MFQVDQCSSSSGMFLWVTSSDLDSHLLGKITTVLFRQLVSDGGVKNVSASLILAFILGSFSCMYNGW